tara:strand:- start:11 stop:622 length:612 start_codon:yes stop_codon:yes gene_type:complete
VITIHDDFGSPDLYHQLLNENLYYAKVHWVGRDATPQNALHDLVHEVLYTHVTQKNVSGATAWYNIRPKNTSLHNDIESYCTRDGVSYRPEVLPEKTFLYYLKEPTSGGHLAIYNRARFIKKGQNIMWKDHEVDRIAPLENRLVSIPADITHSVLPYTGNRVSIAMIFWVELPSIYPPAKKHRIEIYDRVWEIEDSKEVDNAL